MNAGVVLFIALFALCLINVPIAFAMGISSMIAIFYAGYPMALLGTKVYEGLNEYTMIAIPMFMLAGDLMGKGGLSERILDFSKAIVGWVKGSLAMTSIVACGIFASMTGSGVATAAAIGGLVIPQMKKDGYKPEFAAAVTASASVLGPIIPPSIPLIVYASMMGMSVFRLFVGTLIPGLLCMAGLLLYTGIFAHFKKLPKDDWGGWGRVWKTFRRGFFALMLPLIILGGIYMGAFTTTEGAVIAVAYSLFIGTVIYKELKFSEVVRAVLNTSIVTAMMMLAMGAGVLTNWIVAVSRLSNMVANYLTGISSSPLLFIIFLNIFVLIVGIYIDPNPGVILLTPLLAPVAMAFGMDSVTFGVIMCFNLTIGMITPPSAAPLMMCSQLAQAPILKTTIAILPFMGVQIFVLYLVSFFPKLITWLPSVLGVM